MKKLLISLIIPAVFITGCIHLSRNTFDVLGQFRGIRDSVLYFSYQPSGSSLIRTDTVLVREAGLFEYTGRVSAPRMITIVLPSRKNYPGSQLKFMLYNTNYLITGNADSLDSSRVRQGRLQ